MLSLLMRRPDLRDLPPVPAGVELATRDDTAELVRLLDASFTMNWTSDLVRRELLDNPTVQATYLVRRQQQVVATASARMLPERYPDAGLVHWVASDPRLRGRGLGLTVTLAVLHRFAAAGLRSAVLETDDERVPAISAYLRLGFIPEYPNRQHQLRWSKIFRRISLRRQADD